MTVHFCLWVHMNKGNGNNIILGDDRMSNVEKSQIMV